MYLGVDSACGADYHNVCSSYNFAATQYCYSLILHSICPNMRRGVGREARGGQKRDDTLCITARTVPDCLEIQESVLPCCWPLAQPLCLCT